MDCECTLVGSCGKSCSGDTLTPPASSDLGIIREVGMNFGSDPWTLWAEFASSDVYSGVATLLVDTLNHLYLVNSTSGSLVQWTWDYSVNDNTAWQKGEPSINASILASTNAAQSRVARRISLANLISRLHTMESTQTTFSTKAPMASSTELCTTANLSRT